MLPLVMVWVLSGIFRTRSPDAQIAQTASRAMDIAEEARADAKVARRASSGIRILALVMGVSAPLVVVYLMRRLREKSEPGLDEMIDVLQKEGLIGGRREKAQKYLFPRYRVIERGEKYAGDEEDE